MNLNVHVLLWLLVGPLMSASLSGGEEPNLVKLSRSADRRLLGNDNFVEKLLKSEKKENDARTQKVEQLENEISSLEHDIKVVTGYRGKQSRLDKLEEENQQKLCWWPDNFMNYAYAYSTLGGGMSLGIPAGMLTGIHFQVPQTMKAFKFLKRPTNTEDFFLELGEDIDPLAYYFVTRITGQYDKQMPEPISIGFETFGSREVLYSGRNPPSELPVNHKDHLFIMVTYSRSNPFWRVYDTFSSAPGSPTTGDIPDDGFPDTYPMTQLCRCSDMSDRVGAPVGLAVLLVGLVPTFAGPSPGKKLLQFNPVTPWKDYNFGAVLTTGGKRPVFLDSDSSSDVYNAFSDSDTEDYMTYAAPFLTCPLIPLESSRCF